MQYAVHFWLGRGARTSALLTRTIQLVRNAFCRDYNIVYTTSEIGTYLLQGSSDPISQKVSCRSHRSTPILALTGLTRLIISIYIWFEMPRKGLWRMAVCGLNFEKIKKIGVPRPRFPGVQVLCACTTQDLYLDDDSLTPGIFVPEEDHEYRFEAVLPK